MPYQRLNSFFLRLIKNSTRFARFDFFSLAASNTLVLQKSQHMKSQLLFFGFLLFASQLFAQNVGIGTTTPNASAALDISSTSKGITIPRMTSIQRGAITSPATGLLVFDTDTKTIWTYDGTIWKNLYTSGGLTLPFSQTVNLGISAFQVTNQGIGAAIEAASTNEYGTGAFAKATGDYGRGLTAYTNRPGGNSIYSIADSGKVFHGENSYTGNTNVLMSLLNRGVAKTATFQLSNNSSNDANVQIAGNNLGEQLLIFQTNAANTKAAISVSNSGTGAGVSSVANNGTGVSGTSVGGVGVIGTSTTGYGVRGVTNTATGSGGVYGQNTGTAGSGVIGTSDAVNTQGVYGLSINGIGVRANSNVYRAVQATSASGTALFGSSTSGYSLDVSGNVKIAGGNTSPSAGAVLTSVDGSGNAVWKNNKIGFSAEVVSSSVPANTETLVNFATQIFDAGNNFNTSGAANNPSSFIAPVAGFYHFDAALYINIASGVTNISSADIYLMKNGAVNTIEDYGPPENTAFHSSMYMNFSHDIHLNAGDIINLKIFQNNATNITASVIRGRFSGHLIFAD
jgi:hypothetical protein